MFLLKTSYNVNRCKKNKHHFFDYPQKKFSKENCLIFLLGFISQNVLSTSLLLKERVKN
jgi:hypothetical protein